MASEGREQAGTALLGQSYFWDQLVCEAGAFPRASGRLGLRLDLIYRFSEGRYCPEARERG